MPRHPRLPRLTELAHIVALMATLVTAGQASYAAPRPREGARVIPGRIFDDQSDLTAKQRELAKLREWIQAVAEHVPGTADRAAATIAGWSNADLEMIAAPLRFYRDHRTEAPAPLPTDFNGLLRRGAVLHLDVAVVPGVPPAAAVGTAVLMEADGQSVGTGSRSPHWTCARRLLDLLRPEPGRDEIAHLWYWASAVFLHFEGDLAELGPHLTRARQLFPGSAPVLFASGVFYETLAAPKIQSAAPRERNGEPSVGTIAANLREAAGYLRKAVDAEPTWLEPRLRLGHVLAQQGRHEAAEAELRVVASGSVDPILRYYAEMLLGAEEQALGRAELARECYQRAAGLSPRAQSPHLALSQLARGSGDRAGAQSAIDAVLRLSRNDRDRTDPWWSYLDVGMQQELVEVLLERLRASVATGASR